MIRLAETPHATTVADVRGCLPVLGGVFVLSGLTAIWLGLKASDPGALTRLAAVGIGASHVAGGLWLALQPARRTTADAYGVTIETLRWGRAAERRHVSVESIAAVEVQEGRDTDGDRTHRPVVRLQSGEVVALTEHTTPSLDDALAAASAVARRIGRPDALVS